MDRVVQAHAGMVNKFLGDGFLALFGVPLESPDPAGEALRCAAALVAANTALNATRTKRGDESFAIGIGLHLGSVVAGNVGSPHRSEYTVIGDAVNLASRLEGLTKEFDVPIVATRELTDGVHSTPDSVDIADLGTVQVRGRTAPVALVGCTPVAAS
jgi:adenylate cyclase